MKKILMKTGGSTVGNPTRLQNIRRLSNRRACVGVVTSAVAVEDLRETEILTMLMNILFDRPLSLGVKDASYKAVMQHIGFNDPDDVSVEDLWLLTHYVHEHAFGGLLDQAKIDTILATEFQRITNSAFDMRERWSQLRQGPGREAYSSPNVSAENLAGGQLLADYFGHSSIDPSEEVHGWLIVGAGEVMAGKLLAEYLGVPFIDPYAVTRINRDGTIDYNGTRTAFRQKLAELGGSKFVGAGFAGTDAETGVLPSVLERGGTDITAAVYACAHPDVGVIEVRKDVNGIYRADPRILKRHGIKFDQIGITDPRAIREAGAQPLHADALSYVRRYDPSLEVNICSSDNLDLPGTRIVQQNGGTCDVLTMMEGSQKYTAVNVAYDGLNRAVGPIHQMAGHFTTLGIPIDHVATGVDSIMFAVRTSELEPRYKDILERAIRTDAEKSREAANFEFRISGGLAFINIVGEKLGSNNVEVLAKIFVILHMHHIPCVRAVDVGGSSFGIVIGIDEEYYEKAFVVIYKALFTDEYQELLPDQIPLEGE